MHIPLLSIIIPVYQVEDYLEACINSVLAQECEDIEIILVDDGSKDRSGEICDRYAEQDYRITVIHQQNKGLSAARNKGLDICRGWYITFVDSDDELQAATLSQNLKVLMDDPTIDLLEYPVHIYKGAKDTRIWKEDRYSLKNNIAEEWFRDKGYDHSFAWNKIFKRNIWDGLRFPEGKIFEDIYIIAPIIHKVKHYVVSDLGMYYYNAREGSISRSRTPEQYRQILDAQYYLWKSFKDKEALKGESTSYMLGLLDWKIMIARLDKALSQSINSRYQLDRIGLIQLLSLPCSTKRKLKSLPFVIGGEKLHKLIYTLIK